MQPPLGIGTPVMLFVKPSLLWETHCEGLSNNAVASEMQRAAHSSKNSPVYCCTRCLQELQEWRKLYTVTPHMYIHLVVYETLITSTISPWLTGKFCQAKVTLPYYRWETVVQIESTCQRPRNSPVAALGLEPSFKPLILSHGIPASLKLRRTNENSAG